MFEGLVAIVTGGGSGIGKALCEWLSKRGAQVAVVDIDTDSAQAVAKALGGGARAYSCDVADRALVQALAGTVQEDFGGANLVFANAGVAFGGKLEETDPLEFEWVFDVNVGGVFHTTQAFLPLLRDAVNRGESARLVLTGSENSLGLPDIGPMGAYNATKHAVLGLADALRCELDGSGIGVTIFCPGVVATRVWDARRVRHDRYGGTSLMPAEFAARAAKAMETSGMAPELTALQVIEGIERGDFLIVTDRRIRAIAEPRIATINAALDRADTHLNNEGHG